MSPPVKMNVCARELQHKKISITNNIIAAATAENQILKSIESIDDTSLESIDNKNWDEVSAYVAGSVSFGECGDNQSERERERERYGK